MNLTQATTARWELLNTASGLSKESLAVLSELLTREIGYPVTVPIVVEPGTPTKPIAPLPDLTGDAKVAICIGHARSGDAGAEAYNKVYEEPYNNQVALRYKAKLEAKGIACEIINYYPGESYGKAMTWLAKYLKDNNFTHAFELHFNSAGPTAKGYEYLFWHLSKKGVVMAKTFQRMQGERFLDKADRGVEPLGDEAHERGVLFCSITHCPAIILEPFFGSNKDDAESYMSEDGQDKLATFYADATEASIAALKQAA